MLNLYRRHQRPCPYSTRRYRNRKCRIWVQGSLRGEYIRQALNLRSWSAATDLVRDWEAAGEIGVVKKPDIPVISEAVGTPAFVPLIPPSSRGSAQAPIGNEAPLPPVTIADLLRATLRHRPDRILVGEVRGAEAFDLLQALNTGHQGALSTIHANSAEQALARLAHCVLTANTGLPHRGTREPIALAIHLVVHIERVDRTRQVTGVETVSGYETATDRIRLEPVNIVDAPAQEGAFA